MKILKTTLVLAITILSVTAFAQVGSRPGANTSKPAKQNSTKSIQKEIEKQKIMKKENAANAAFMKDLGVNPMSMISNLKDIGLDKKAIDLVKGKNVDMLKQVMSLTENGAKFGDAFKTIKSLNKSNLSAFKDFLPKDQFKPVKLLQNGIMDKVKSYLINKLK